MILRRDLLGAMMALFAGVLLPEPVLKPILVRPSWPPATLPEWKPVGNPQVLTPAHIEAALKVIFAEPIPTPMIKEFSDFHSAAGWFVSDVIPPDAAYVEQGHFWTLPCGLGWEMKP